MRPRQSTFRSDPSTRVDGVDEKVSVVTSNIPHEGSSQVFISDEFSLGGERPNVIIVNHQLFFLVVKEGLVKRSKRINVNVVGSERSDSQFGCSCRIGIRFGWCDSRHCQGILR